MRDQTSTSKASCNVFLAHNFVVCGVVRGEEFNLGNVVNMRLDEHVDFSAIRALQRAENSDVERLGKMR